MKLINVNNQLMDEELSEIVGGAFLNQNAAEQAVEYASANANNLICLRPDPAITQDCGTTVVVGL